MSREIIFTIVFMVFAYIIGKYKLLPYFAAKKILKDAKKDKQGSQDNGATTVSPALPLQMPYAMPYGGYPVTLPHQSMESPIKRETGFDYCVITYDSDSDGIDCIDCYHVGQMFGKFQKSGATVDTFDIVNLGDGLAIAYATYHM